MFLQAGCLRFPGTGVLLWTEKQLGIRFLLWRRLELHLSTHSSAFSARPCPSHCRVRGNRASLLSRVTLAFCRPSALPAGRQHSAHFPVFTPKPILQPGFLIRQSAFSIIHRTLQVSYEKSTRPFIHVVVVGRVKPALLGPAWGLS